MLLARLRLHLRQHVSFAVDASSATLTPHKAIVFGSLSIDPVNRQVLLGGDNVALSTADFDLLWELATHAGQIMDRDALLKKISAASATTAWIAASMSPFHACVKAARQRHRALPHQDGAQQRLFVRPACLG